ncbi:hypothetical protein WEN_02340 [Mycoplasma wenyonii str. Massachusetts]|uniref:Uncharacterized protein n=1 Tax=Mycoplasma wenyonii (strain Massachusetts) TaxID=1197325 RepID=I6ZJ96_MYCWM|nr:hypothetical protein [Mycoplasma wenyonii]AFN65255.1 hypothetical protein WEN_02340 [Mycoplasma wenyonii str. Massachusetts]
MALGVALKVILSLLAGTAVVAPVSYLASSGVFSSAPLFTYQEGENCQHLPLKPSENEKKLLVCVTKENTKPIFKWWTKGGTESEKTEEISTLSWKEKTDTLSDSLDFELELQLKEQTASVKEPGLGAYYLPSTPLKNLENNCSFNYYYFNKGFELRCTDIANGDTGNKEHNITVRRVPS